MDFKKVVFLENIINQDTTNTKVNINHGIKIKEKKQPKLIIHITSDLDCIRQLIINKYQIGNRVLQDLIKINLISFIEINLDKSLIFYIYLFIISV